MTEVGDNFDKLANSWQGRVMTTLRINATEVGHLGLYRLAAAILNVDRGKVPRIEGPATVRGTGQHDQATGLEIGNMFVTVVTENPYHGYAGKRSNVFLMTTLLYRDTFRRLADLLKFTDADRVELFTELSKFIGKDDRVRTDLGGNIKEI
jgi:hypothetical protein